MDAAPLTRSGILSDPRTGTPVICIIINGLAITHVQRTPVDKDTIKAREVVITIRIKSWNIVLILLSLLIIGLFIGYAMTMNISIKN